MKLIHKTVAYAASVLLLILLHAPAEAAKGPAPSG
jgi:hypothetical protein